MEPASFCATYYFLLDIKLYLEMWIYFKIVDYNLHVWKEIHICSLVNIITLIIVIIMHSSIEVVLGESFLRTHKDLKE